MGREISNMSPEVIFLTISLLLGNLSLFIRTLLLDD